MSRTLASTSGSVENLNVWVRHGCSPHARHTFATATFEIPSAWANRRLDQWVTPRCSGGSSRVASTIATSSSSFGRPERGRSSSAPIPPSA